MRKKSLSAFFLSLFCLAMSAQEETIENLLPEYNLTEYRYWFDSSSQVTRGTYKNGNITIDASELDEGIHILHYQVVSNLGEVSPVSSAMFYRMQEGEETFKDYAVTKVRYWFDNASTVTETDYAGKQFTIDASALDEGIHTLHYQVENSLGEMSPASSAMFYRMQEGEETFKEYAITKVRYWFDSSLTVTETDYAGKQFTIDASALDEGIHTLHYQVENSLGEMSPTSSAIFFRMREGEESFKDYAITKVRYWFDNSPTVLEGEYTGRLFSIDAAALEEGVHTLYYQAVNNFGDISPICSMEIDRYLYDIYISRTEEYNDSIITNNPLFTTKPDLKLHFASNDVDIRGHLTVNEDATLSLGKFVQTTNLGNQTTNRFNKTGIEYFHPTTLVNYGFMRADSVLVKLNLYRDRWHFISLPFNVSVSDIDVPDDTYWALRKYDGEARAAGILNETWKNLRRGDMMEAGCGYILQLTKEGEDKTSWLTFKSINDTHKNDIFITKDVTVALEEHQSEFAHNRSWNLVGNPYPSFFDSRYIEQEGNIIVWNGNGYSAYSLSDDDFVLMPFEAFFIQRPVNSETLTFNKEGRQHTHEVREQAALMRRKSKTNVNRQIFNFTLFDDKEEDHSRIVINEEASMNYESDKDAPKFMENRPQKVQLFSVDLGVKYAINERPLTDGLVTFSLYVPSDGEYNFHVDGNIENMTVLDTMTGNIWHTADGDYVFMAEAGMYEGRFIVSLTGETTGISQIRTGDESEIHVVGYQLSFHLAKAKQIKVFGLDGRMYYSGTVTDSNITLRRGIYVVSLDGEKMKIMVK